MAAPAHTARQAPTGYKLPDGFSSKIAFSSKPAVSLWEMTVKPSGKDGGDAIPTSTMHNVRRHTFAPRTLVKDDEIVVTFAYDPDFESDIEGMLNVNQAITQLFPTGDYKDFWGFLRKVEFGELKEGDMPTGTATICVSNTDASGAESPPVYHAAAGT